MIEDRDRWSQDSDTINKIFDVLVGIAAFVAFLVLIVKVGAEVVEMLEKRR